MSLKDIFLEVFIDKKIHDKYTKTQIIEMFQAAAKARGENYSSGSIIPSDYCYNRSNAGIIFDSTPHLFVLGDDGIYEYLGVDYNYEGKIVNISGETNEMREIGQWVDRKAVFTIRTVNSVWLGAAVLAFNKYYQVDGASQEDMYFKQEEIVKMASHIHGGKVPSALVSSQCSDSNQETNYKYLVPGNGAREKLRRLSFTGEFEGKHEKPNLDLDWTVRTNKGDVKVKDIIQFVDNEYKGLFNNGGKENMHDEKVEVDFKKETFKPTETKGEDRKMRESKYDKNMILYGPPGTGKTYNAINYAVAIIENKSIDEISNENHLNVIDRYNQYKQKGRITFTTFHQSYGYEEFIEGIKPVMAGETETDGSDIQYEIKSGLFKEFCERAQNPIIENENIYGIKDNPEIWKISLKGAGENEVRRDCFDHDRIRIGWDSYGKEITDQTVYKNGGQGVLDSFINQMEIGDIVLTLYDNKTIDAIGVVQDDYDWLELDAVTEYKRSRRVKWIIKDVRENIIDINGGKVLTLSSVYRLSRIQLADVTAILSKHNIGLDSAVKENKDEYVFIIDEINRGNISKIFGELITLIECTKRLGAEEAMTATLPYSPKPFGVPSNVYVLGTMNTADRSIALMDTALRRRFEFIEMMPKAEILSGIQVGAINIKKMLETMNERIEYLYDREHTIGHSYFLRLTNDLTLKNLSAIFKNSIIPLLQEYFYEDYSKIQLVLGDNGKDDEFKFIKDEVIKIKNVFKGNPENVDLPEKKYSIQDSALRNEKSYIQIYE